MKKYYLVVILLFVFIFQSCESSTEVNLSSYSKSTIDTMDDYQFPNGTYYIYNFSTSSETVKPEEEIEKLLENNIIVNQVWYRNPLNGCSPPGAGWTTRTIYRATFLVLLKNPDDEISNEKYSKLSEAPYIGCGYYVINFKLKYQ
jgi:hypothetical protein